MFLGFFNRYQPVFIDNIYMRVRNDRGFLMRRKLMASLFIDLFFLHVTGTDSAIGYISVLQPCFG